MKNIRCDAVILQIIATEYDDLGRPVNEYLLPQSKVFRATARDFWAEVDRAVGAAVKQAQAQQQPKMEPPAPMTVVKKGKRR